MNDKLTHYLTVDVNLYNLQSIRLKQYNQNSQRLVITVTENNQPYFVDKNLVTCAFKMITPDDRAIYNECTINDDGTITVDITESCCTRPGKGEAELDIIRSDDDYQLCTMNFHMIIEKSVYGNDKVIAAPEFDLLAKAVAGSQKLNNDIKESETTRTQQEESREAAERSRTESENNRVSNENQRINAENGRIDAETLRISAEEARETAVSNTLQTLDSLMSDAIEATENAQAAAKDAGDAADACKNLSSNTTAVYDVDGNSIKDTYLKKTDDLSKLGCFDEFTSGIQKQLDGLNTDKVDKAAGKGLSSNDYTTDEKNKLAGIASGANAYSLPLSSSSARGGAKVGYSQNGKNYPVQLSNEQMFVNVPWTDTNTWRGVQNNLTSTSATDALSAAQGKVLADNLAGKAAASHTHNYLPLTGGTLAGNLTVNKALTVGDSIATNGTLTVSSNATVKGWFRSEWAYHNTSSSAANVQINDAGTLRRSASSSKRYKHDIRPLADALDASKLLSVPVVQYIYNEGYLPEDDPRCGQYIPGFIAEDIAGLYPAAAETNADGQPEDWNIRLIVPPMLALIQDLYKRIEQLEQGENGD